MSNIVLKVENISKQYRLGKLGTGTISHDLNRMWAKMRGKEDPYLKVGDANDRSKISGSDYVWSLKDINFEVMQGEVLGIIGKNGAGKSTLLKILSQVTTPTTGEVKVKGRIAALLEVGTGFHPDLTGRENIFLNGAILGMSKAEIKRKLDEIIDFSGVAKYLDTPVKRYSSGMMVRLAFAVAAYLESEILIVDEVLAVGDAEFQKKCLGKMKDVSSGEGRTVLFVSHNISAVQSLCTKAVLLENGKLKHHGHIGDTIKKYLNSNKYVNKSTYIFNAVNKWAYATQLKVFDLSGEALNEIPLGKPWCVEVDFEVKQNISGLIVGLGMVNEYETPIRTSWNKPQNLRVGKYRARFIEKNIIFSGGEYKFVIGLSIGTQVIQYIDENIYITISDVVEKLDESILKNTNGVLLNPMEMNISIIN